jgi:hypothetical protein
VTAPNAIYERNIKENDYYSEKLIVKCEKKSNNFENYRLFDYIKSGIRIACHISLDLSNGEDKQFISQKSDRDCIDYSNIIENITDIISNYIPNRLVHAYGIGGEISYGYNSQKVFKINMGGNDSNKLYNRILEDYHNSLNEIKLDNKVYFSPLINKVNNYIFDSKELNYYNILFILTKETIDKSDIKKTYDSIIDSSYLPVSIIIIGIGQNNFDKMKNIFDSVPINSRVRKKKFRKNVIFVSSIAEKLENSQIMTEWCLKEIEKQAMQYYELLKIKPENIQLNDYDIIRNSFSLFKSNPYIIEEENDDDYIDSSSDKKKDKESEKNTTFSQNYVPSDDDKSDKEDITDNGIKMSENLFKNTSTFNKVSNEVENSINKNPCLKENSINNENNDNQKQNNEYDNPNNNNNNNRKESIKLNDEQNEINLISNNNNQNDDKKLNNDNDKNNGENNKNAIVNKSTLPPSSINDIKNNNNENNANPYTKRKTLPAGSINFNNSIDLINPYINDIKKKNEEKKQIDVKNSSIFIFNTNENNEKNEDYKSNENYVNNNYFNLCSKNYINEIEESQNKANNSDGIKKNNYISGNSGLMSTKNSEFCKVSNNVF